MVEFNFIRFCGGFHFLFVGYLGILVYVYKYIDCRCALAKLEM